MIPRYAPTYTIKDILNGFRLSSNPEVENNLIARLKSLTNAKNVFLFGSGREALYAILRAHNRPGRVLIPAYNCIVVPEAIQFAGYTPNFVDIDRQSLSMTPEGVKNAFTNDVQAVFLTHLFGIPCEIQEILDVIRQHEILIVEDAAPALGAEYHGQIVGNFADAAIISFQSTKVISGEAGGALLVNNDDLANKVRNLLTGIVKPESTWRLFMKAFLRRLVTRRLVYSAAQLSYRALRGEQIFEVVSPQRDKPPRFFTRCPSFASALVLEQIDRLEWNLDRRRRIAEIYRRELSNCTELIMPVIPINSSPSWIQFPVLTNKKWELYKYMQRQQVDLTWTFRYSCADSYNLDGFPESQKAAKTVLGLPSYPSLTEADIHYICTSIKNYFNKS